MARRAKRKPAGIEAEGSDPNGADAATAAAKKVSDNESNRRPEMTWRDHLLMLLYFGAAIEHALMVQYLYAAYSIGGDQIPKEHRKMVQGWRSSILSVAKEEMGHLLTVQNVLTLLGSPINLYRRDFPYDTKYNPFPPSLRPFSIECLELLHLRRDAASGGAWQGTSRKAARQKVSKPGGPNSAGGDHRRGDGTCAEAISQDHAPHRRRTLR